MAKTVKKKATKARRTVKAKAKTKPKARAKKLVAKSAAPPVERSFMQRLLEKKQAAIKQKELMKKNSGHPAWESTNSIKGGEVLAFSRFHGPRRKAA